MTADPEAPAQASPAPTLRVAVVGAGGIGGYFGALLARAGHDVELLARGPHLDAMRQRGGIEVHEPDGSTLLAPVRATDDAGALSGAPYTILAVKTYSLGEVAPTLRALAASGSTILPLLNGVDITDRLLALGVPRSALLGGVAYITTARTAPGVITRSGAIRRVVLGELDGRMSERTSAFAAAFRAVGVDTRATDAIALELWRKFAFLVPMASICALARHPIGVAREVPLGRTVIERMVRELVAVARASGIPFSDDDTRQTLGGLEALPALARPSFLADLERGGPTEIDALSGTVVRLARTLGIDTPVHETVVAAVTAQTSGPG